MYLQKVVYTFTMITDRLFSFAHGTTFATEVKIFRFGRKTQKIIIPDGEPLPLGGITIGDDLSRGAIVDDEIFHDSVRVAVGERRRFSQATPAGLDEIVVKPLGPTEKSA